MTVINPERFNDNHMSVNETVYEIVYTESSTFSVKVRAETEKQAREIFEEMYNDDYAAATENAEFWEIDHAVKQVIVSDENE